MTQPSGRVLGSSSQYRTYLRSSPIVCAVDALFFLLRLVLSPIILGIPASQAIDITIQERYKGVHDPVEGIQYLEKQTWLRWLFFVIGTLGPAIKLAAMQGVPWTKAWGMMFLGAFVVFESIVFLKKDRSERAEHTQGESVSARTSVTAHVNAQVWYTNRVEQRVFVFAIMIHVLTVYWAVRDLCRLQAPTWQIMDKDRVISVGGSWPFSGTLAAAVVLVFVEPINFNILISQLKFFSSILLGWHGGAWDEDSIFRRAIILSLSFILFQAPLVTFAELLAMDDKRPFMIAPSFSNLSLYFVSFTALLLLISAINRLCSKYPTLGVNLLMVPETTRESRSPVTSAWTLVFFVVNLTVCTLWYCFRYDSTGTINPSWTGIFG